MAMGIRLLATTPEGEATRDAPQENGGWSVPVIDSFALAAEINRLSMDLEEVAEKGRNSRTAWKGFRGKLPRERRVQSLSNSLLE